MERKTMDKEVHSILLCVLGRYHAFHSAIIEMFFCVSSVMYTLLLKVSHTAIYFWALMRVRESPQVVLLRNFFFLEIPCCHCLLLKKLKNCPLFLVFALPYFLLSC